MDKVEKLVDETIKETSASVSNNDFMNHVFNFDNNTKNELMNIIQYGILSVIPIVILNKSVSSLIPEASETKDSVEILAEIVGQMLMLFVGMFYIHRLVTFIPTYSKQEYPSVNLINIMLSFLVIVLSLQTKLGEKVNIVYERVMNRINGNPMQSVPTKETTVKVIQPISQGVPTQKSDNNYENTRNVMTGAPEANMDNMYENTGGTMRERAEQQALEERFDTQSGGNQMSMEPMAANDGFGAFGSVI